MIDGSDEFMSFRNDPAFAGMTDEQIKQMIGSEGAVVSSGNSFSLAPGASTDYGMEAPNPYMSPAGNQFDFGNTQNLAATNSYSSMSLAPGSNIEGGAGPNQYQSAADGTFTNSYEAPNSITPKQLTTTGPSNVMNTVSQGINLVNQIKPLLGTGGLKGILGKIGLSGGAGGAGLAGLAPLAPLAIGAGALLYMKNRKKKKREKKKADLEAKYKSRKLEQKQDLIDANQDYMEMASRYNNTYNIR